MTVTHNTSHEIRVFSDGSFCPRTKIGVLGVAIFLDKKTYESNNFNLANTYFAQISETSCSRVELRSAIMSLKILNESHGSKQLEKSAAKIALYSDNQAITNLSIRRQKLESHSYRSQNTGKPLKSAELYREFYLHYDSLKPTLIWVKGHTSKDRTRDEQCFRNLDILVRKRLRSAIKRENALPL